MTYATDPEGVITAGHDNATARTVAVRQGEAINASAPTQDDVRRICLSLPGVVERPSWDQPAWFARTLMARIWEAGVLTVKTDEREALVGDDPATFFWTPHHDRSPKLVLVRLQMVQPDELEELLQDSYRIAGTPKNQAWS